MKVHYLEIVTTDVDAVCAAYAAANGLQFGKPDAGLGNARTATLPGGGLVGVRAPLSEVRATGGAPLLAGGRHRSGRRRGRPGRR